MPRSRPAGSLDPAEGRLNSAMVCPLAVATAVVVAVVAAGTLAAPAAGSPSGGLLATVPGSSDPQRVLITVTVDPDGDATWQVRYTFSLRAANASTAFEELEATIEADPAPYRDRFAGRMREIVRSAEGATDRDMAVRNVSIEARTDPFTTDRGYITYRFEWDGFARTGADGLVVGDAVDGLFLTRNTTLTVAWPAGYTATSIRPRSDTQDANAVTWTGERNFGPGEPRVILDPPTGPSADTGDDGTPAAAGPSLPSLPLGPSVGVLMGILVGTIAVAGAAWRFRTRIVAATHHGRPAHGSGNEPPADELLSNEERVLAVLERQGGRAKQQDVVEATGWSEVKTSEVVQDLREAGTIEAFRLGRENVLSLPDEDG